MISFRSQLLGTWELVSVTATNPEDASDVIYPMGKEPRGLIMYTADGYMSCQQQEPGATPYSGSRDFADGTDKELAETARRYLAYSGPFYLDETPGETPKLWHGMTVSLIPNWIGNVQPRTARIQEENGTKYLTLSPGKPSLSRGEMRLVEIKWKKLKANTTARPPSE